MAQMLNFDLLATKLMINHAYDLVIAHINHGSTSGMSCLISDKENAHCLSAYIFRPNNHGQTMTIAE